MQFNPTRDHGLARLANFLPNAGRKYADTRNFDDGSQPPGFRANVSQLSPWLHAGLISECEVCETVLGRHSPEASDKFIAEVFWRIYFKGYLEQRPTIWRAYLRTRDAALDLATSNAGVRRAYEQATNGDTGIEAFDHWVRELVATGYLHNHARMWFASIWIFTLKLDWTLGADFFLRHLVDGDAASNTLSWRWVAGLHTKGKTYLARPDNISRYTARRKDGPLAAKGLASEAPALSEGEDHPRKRLDFAPPPGPLAMKEPYALLLHDEGASHEILDLIESPALVISASRPDFRSPGAIGQPAQNFAHQSVQNAAERAAKRYDCKQIDWAPGERLEELLSDAGVNRVIYPYLPTGWTRDALIGDLAPLEEDGNAIALLGDLQRLTWPHAKAGFFGVKKQIPQILREAGIGEKTPDLFD